MQSSCSPPSSCASRLSVLKTAGAGSPVVSLAFPGMGLAARASGVARTVLLYPASLDLPEATVQRFHQLLLGDDAALARHGLIVFFVLRHLSTCLWERSRGARLEPKASAIRRSDGP